MQASDSIRLACSSMAATHAARTPQELPASTQIIGRDSEILGALHEEPCTNWYNSMQCHSCTRRKHICRTWCLVAAALPNLPFGAVGGYRGFVLGVGGMREIIKSHSIVYCITQDNIETPHDELLLLEIMFRHTADGNH